MNLAGRDAPFLEALRLLRCATAVTQHGSALRAAEAMYVSQPAVTRAVKDLEKKLGVSLFDRGARGMSPTLPGRLVSQRTAALLTQLEHGVREACALGSATSKAPSSPSLFAARVLPSSLDALVAISIYGSEVRAAKHLHVTQPAVHRGLDELQHLVGAALFHRSPRGTRLTLAGNALLHRVKLAFAELRALRADLAAWRGEVRGELVIGALPLSVSLLLPKAVDRVLQTHTELEIRVIDGTYEALVEQLLRADIDIFMGALRFPPPEGVQQQVLLEDSIAIVAHHQHSIFTLSTPTLADLLHHPWVLPLANSPAEAALHQIFVNAGLPPPAGRLRAGSPTLTRSLALQTGRLALASPGEALRPEAAPLQIVPLQLPHTIRRIGIAWRSDGEPAADLLSLIQALTQPNTVAPT